MNPVNKKKHTPSCSQELSVEVINNWRDLGARQHQWNALQARAENSFPFSSFEWVDAWYRAYCPAEKARIIMVHDADGLRAILPGMAAERRIGGMKLSCFVYVCPYHTPRSGVIAETGDTKAAMLALKNISRLDTSFDFATLNDIAYGSVTREAILNGMIAPLHPVIDNSYESYVYEVPRGWSIYHGSRSKNFRKRLRQSFRRCETEGHVKNLVFRSGRDLEEGIKRMRLLNERSWQRDSETGMFTSEKDEIFYERLCALNNENLRVEVSILQISGVDVAFSFYACRGVDVFFLRIGYDQDFAFFRPGVVNQAMVTKRLAAEGLMYFDSGPNRYEEKRHWETFRRPYENYWLINKNTVKGNLLLFMISAYRRYKAFRYRKRGGS